MKVLISGITGFIGSRLAVKLRDQGHEAKGFTRHYVKDPPWELIKAWKPEVYIHGAGITGPGYLEAHENYDLLFDSLEFIRNLNSVDYILGLGSCAEQEPSMRHTSYAQCKRTLLEYLSYLEVPSFGWARIFYPYGPGEPKHKFCSNTFTQLINKKLYWVKQQWRDYIYIDDLVDALVLMVEKRPTGIIDIGTGAPSNTVTMACRIEDLVDTSFSVETLIRANLREPGPRIVGDPSELHKLGWTPKVSLDEGLKRLYQTFKVSEQ